MQNTDKLYVESLHRYRLFRVAENMTNTCCTFSNRNLQTSKAPLKSQAQGTSLFTSAASNQRGFPKNSPWVAQVWLPEGERMRQLRGVFPKNSPWEAQVRLSEGERSRGATKGGLEGA